MSDWVGMAGHGTQVVAETPGILDKVGGVAWTDVVGLRQGWGTTFRGRSGTSGWFHQPIPAVPLFGHASARLGELQLRLETRGTAQVTAIHLWSGGQRLKVWEGLALTGAQNFVKLVAPEVDQPGWGLNACALVSFGASTSEVTFLGGYARYVTA